MLLQNKNLDALIKNYDLIYSRFIYGVGTYLNVLSAYEDVLTQRLLIADLEHSRLMAALKLIKSLGGGYYCPTGTPLNKIEEDHG